MCRISISIFAVTLLLLWGTAPVSAASCPSVAAEAVASEAGTLVDQLATCDGTSRTLALQEVIRRAHFDRSRVDVAKTLPVLFSVASGDVNSHHRTMAAQAIATIGSRADGRRLHRIAQRDPSPRARQQMGLAAAAAMRG